MNHSSIRIFIVSLFIFIGASLLAPTPAHAQANVWSSIGYDARGTTEVGRIINDFLGKALTLMRISVLNFLLIYGVYLGVGMAFGQAQATDVVSFFLGAIVAVGAQAISFVGLIFDPAGSTP